MPLAREPSTSGSFFGVVRCGSTIPRVREREDSHSRIKQREYGGIGRPSGLKTRRVSVSVRLRVLLPEYI